MTDDTMTDGEITDDEIERICAWLVRGGLEGMPEPDMLRGFAERCVAAGLPLSQALTIIDTLHPVYEGRAFPWRADGHVEKAVIEYGRTNEGEAAQNWQNGVFFHMLTTGRDELRVRLAFGDPDTFTWHKTLRTEGQTDYVALIHRFAGDGIIGEMDCLYSRWSTDHPDGFTEGHLRALRRLVPSLVLAIKCASLARIAGTLVEVYLGQDAGRRVLSGRISRGTTEKINAVLWFSDLRGYTKITDTAAPSEIIPLLNDYAEAVIGAIYDAGGDVLKLMGDGILAIFNADDPAVAARSALTAQDDMRRRVSELNARRTAEERPTTHVYLGLNIGDVFYGNIGSDERLDFTVVGPAVNEVSRIASMCRSADQPLLLSPDFVAALPPDGRARIVSVGRFALRGVGRAQELFTLDPGLRQD